MSNQKKSVWNDLKNANADLDVPREKLDFYANAYLDSDFVGAGVEHMTFSSAPEGVRNGAKRLMDETFETDGSRSIFRLRDDSNPLYFTNFEKEMMRTRDRHAPDCKPVAPSHESFPTKVGEYFHPDMDQVTRQVLMTTPVYSTLVRVLDAIGANRLINKSWTSAQFKSWLQQHAATHSFQSEREIDRMREFIYQLDSGKRCFILIMFPVIDNQKMSRRGAYLFFSCLCKVPAPKPYHETVAVENADAFDDFSENNSNDENDDF